MQRVVIFAHYDCKNLIEDYVVCYINELKKVAQKIIFASDCDIEKDELKKLPDDVKIAHIGRHGEYDFGSYKRGFFYAKENGLLNDCEELIFANDSCYAPLFSFSDMFDKMSKKDVDFWGNTVNLYSPQISCGKFLSKKQPHIQSYFLVFKKNVFNHPKFVNFMTNIKKEKTKWNIVVNYECALTPLLADLGFRYDCYCPYSLQVSGSHIVAYDKLVKIDKSPFLKRSVVLYKNASFKYPLFLKRLIKKYTNYDFELIQKDRDKNETKLSFLKIISKSIKEIRRKIFAIHYKQGLIWLFGKKIRFTKSIEDKQKKHLVVLHLYYTYMWDEFKKYIKNLDKYCAYDLIVTLGKENKELEEKILNDFPYAEVKICENNKYGADIWPFFEVINSVNLDDYDLVFKLHTKQDFEKMEVRLPRSTKIKFYVGKCIWRQFLLYAILYKKNLKKCLWAFKCNKKLGMWGFRPLLVKTLTKNVVPKYYEKLPRIKDKYFNFFAGTIFVLRADILKCVQNLYKYEDFNVYDNYAKFTRLTYEFEDYFAQLALAQGYKIGGIDTKLDKLILQMFSNHITKALYKPYIKYRYKIEVS